MELKQLSEPLNELIEVLIINRKHRKSNVLIAILSGNGCK